MANELQLKKRSGADFIRVPIPLVKRLVEEENPEEIVEFFRSAAEADFGIHDRVWLETIINWVPEDGHPLSESAKWFKLAQRVAELDEDKEGTFTLSRFQTDLIWDRITNPKFKVAKSPLPFIEFISHFQEVTGKHFPEEDPGE